MKIVKKEFRYAVGGITATVFEKGTPADALPADARTYAERKDLLEGKAVAADENKSVEGSPETKGKKGR